MTLAGFDRSPEAWRATVKDAAIGRLLRWDYSHDKWATLQKAHNLLSEWKAQHDDGSLNA